MPLSTCYLGAISLVALLTIAGCGVESARDAGLEDKRAMPADAPAAGAPVLEGFAMGARFFNSAGGGEVADGVGIGQPMANTAPGATRKIIYEGQVDLVVEDFTGVPELVVELVKKYEAYVAASNLQGASGDNRRATWTIRVPVERYEAFVGAAKGLGEVKSVGTTSRDVSEEYYDVEARIRNKTKEEERLLTLLEERPGDLKDVIAIERELSRVREELERMQGRMRVLADLTSLTTVKLSIEEIKDYQPPQSPTLATRARRAFDASVGSIQSAGASLLIAVVALAPWLPIAVVVMLPGYAVLRRARRRSHSTTSR